MVIACVCCYLASAQDREEEVKQTIQQLFTAMRNADGPSITALFTDSSYLQTIAVSASGEARIQNSTVESFARAVSKSKKGALDEQITFGGIHIDGALASVWTPYKFFFDGNFNHCGANSFQLVLTKGGWKIQYLIDTRRKEGCW